MTESDTILHALGPLLFEALELQSQAAAKHRAAVCQLSQGRDALSRQCLAEAEGLRGRASALIAEAQDVQSKYGKPPLEAFHMEVVAGWWRAAKEREEV